MVNVQLFKTTKAAGPLAGTLINEAGGRAYAISPKHALAQYAMTGSLSNTYYTSAETQLDQLLLLCEEIDPAFIAKTAIYCRKKGLMKDSPALLTAILTVRGPQYLPAVFDSVIDNGKMLRAFVQILRSGAVGRKSLGSRPKKLVQSWLLRASEAALLQGAVGNTPSLGDVVKMVHPAPTEAWQEAFFAWLIGKPFDMSALPPITQAFEAYKQDKTLPVPPVPFQMLTALSLNTAQWSQIARQAPWQMLRMNLNTFARHGVFEEKGMTALIAKKLADPVSVSKARVFPYQLMAAYAALDASVPSDIREALQAALDAALANVPDLPGEVVVCPDVSGSMGSPATGTRKGATSVVRCIDVAALVAAALLKKNPKTRVLPFAERVVDVHLNPRDSVMTNAARLSAIGGGGTCCSAPLALLNEHRHRAQTVILISDNQSWIDNRTRGATETLRQWEMFRRHNPEAKLVCIDIQPFAHTQAMDRRDILNIGGFSDEIFTLLARFCDGHAGAQHWVDTIEEITL